MKYIVLLLLFTLHLFAAMIKAPILSVDEKHMTATIKLDHIDVGVSGFIVHTLAPNHTSILKNAHVIKYDKESHIATLKMSEFTALRNNSLPSGKWKVSVGDEAQLAFGYSRALLIAPSEEIYHRITKSVQIQWVHVDLFATVLSYRGHPTPLKEDFEAMSRASSVGLLFFYLDQKVYTLDIKSFTILSISDAPLKEDFEAMSIAGSIGLVFFYLDQKVYTVDIKSFKILSISAAPLKQDSVKLPFYSRVEKIDANWFGKGNEELKAYAPYYYELLIANNKKNKQLYEVIKNGDPKLHYLLKEFEIGE